VPKKVRATLNKYNLPASLVSIGITSLQQGEREYEGWFIVASWLKPLVLEFKEGSPVALLEPNFECEYQIYAVWIKNMQNLPN
jgi:hypothetical protein